MVLLNYKKTENNQFLYETTVESPVEQAIQDLIEINNQRVLIDCLACSIEDLATNGVMRPEVLRGLSSEDLMKTAVETYPEEVKKFAEPIVLKPGQRLNEDKNAYRHGVILSEDITQMMINETSKAKMYVSAKQVTNKVVLTKEKLKEHIDNLRGSLMIAYPGYYGLPDYEPARMILENNMDFAGLQQDHYEWYIEKDTSLWWAGKEMIRGKFLKDYIGKNEKTKIVCRLQKPNAGAPVREPTVDEETQKKMMAFYYKKQEEMKKLDENDEDQYLNSAWANPNQMKNQLNGNGQGIKYKAF